MSLAIATATVDATAAIKAVIEDIWTGAGQDAALIFWNDTTNNAQAGALWMRIVVDFGSNTAGDWNSLNRQIGLIQLRIFGPLNAGTGRIRAIADAFKAALNRTQSGGVIFQNPFTGEGSRGPFRASSGAYAGQGLDVPFYYWEAL